MTGGRNLNNQLNTIALKDYQETVSRRQELFKSVRRFLVIDAFVFWAALIWACYMVMYHKADWHVFMAALLPGALGAVVAVMALKAIYRVPRQDDIQTEDLAPNQGILKGIAGDLSGD